MMSSITHNPIAIANYFIKKSGYNLDLMQVLKLSYIAHGFKLGLTEKPLSNELVQAWKFGPVFSSVYHKFKYEPPGEKIQELGMKKRIVPVPIKSYFGNENMSMIKREELQSNFSDEDKKIMDTVCYIYGELTGIQLSVLTHKEKTPWYQTYYNEDCPGEKFHGVTIPNEEIKKHYSDVVLKKLRP